MTPDFLEDLKRAIKEYDEELVINSVKGVLAGGTDPNKVFEAMTDAIREVGVRFNEGELWLPDLMAASDTMSKATPIVEEALKKTASERRSLGNVVIGTVRGDIHSTGKSMVALLLTAEGFAVHDLGVNVNVSEFVKAIKEHNAEILCVSALMTTTLTGMKDVIDALGKEGIRDKVKVLVGGAPVNQEYADRIGADGYDPTAPGGARLARKLIGRGT